MTRPRIALCIPAFQAQGTLPRLLQAVAQQTIPFDETLVYDDASSDRTSDVARGWGVEVVRGKENAGCSIGKNILAAKTTCEWIHFHDADDSLLPEFVAKAREWATSAADGPDIVLFAYEMRDEKTGASLGIRQFDDTALQADALRYAIREQLNPFCGLYRRNAFLSAGGYDTDPNVLYNEDVAFHCRMALRKVVFRADPEVQIVNFCRRNSMSSANRPKCARAQFHVMQKVTEELARDNRLQDYSDAIAARLWEIATFSGSFCDWEYVDFCVALARRLGSSFPQEAGTGLFRSITRISPRYAYRLREKLIRLFRPTLRTGSPSNNP